MTSPVIIIGAGLAGLYAGLLLKQRGIDFNILEASQRIGGRILSKPHSTTTNEKLAVDLGPVWFWPHQTEMIELMQMLEIPYFRQYTKGDALFQADNQSPIERFLPSYMESFRVVGGMYSFIEKLATKLPRDSIDLGYQVDRISKHDSGWCIEAQGNDKAKIFTDKLIIAAPPRVIIEKFHIENSVLTPLINELATVPTWMAAQAKFVATYDQAFWREQGLSGQAFSRQGPMVEIHDSSAGEDNGFALFGFIGVPGAERQHISSEDFKQACLQQLGQIFGKQAFDIELCYLEDWASNELIAKTADISKTPRHPYIDLTPYRKVLVEQGLYFWRLRSGDSGSPGICAVPLSLPPRP